MDHQYNVLYGAPPTYDPENMAGYATSTYYNDQFTPQAPVDDARLVQHGGYSMSDVDPFTSHWLPQQAHSRQPQGHHRQRSDASTSAQSTSTFSTRYSNASIFSQQHGRSSVASTSTTWSQFSDPTRASWVDQQLPANSTTAHPTTNNAAPHQAQLHTAPLNSIAQQQDANTTTKTQYATCLSRTKRSRRATKGEPRYFCTSCHEGFREKYDWKRHEETYQERSETFQCDNCTKTYFLEKDFVHHHRESHRCQTCAENAHVELARRTRRTRTGWGCGFCIHFSSDWTERCNHIAKHFERGDTMERWKQTWIILSLLQSPLLAPSWNSLLETKGEANPSFGWSHRWAGRADGYPDSDNPPQLQDLLEFFTPDQNSTALVQLAYEMGHQPQRPRPQDKELPPLPTPAVPVDDGFMPWNQLMSTIPEDEFIADGIPDFHQLY